MAKSGIALRHCISLMLFFLMTMNTHDSMGLIKISDSIQPVQASAYMNTYRRRRGVIRDCKHISGRVYEHAGFLPLTGENMNVQFINGSSAYTVKVTWKTPTRENRSELASYLFFWFTGRHMAIECVELTSKTNSYEIALSRRLREDSLVNVKIQPQPEKRRLYTGEGYIKFIPTYKNVVLKRTTWTSTKSLSVQSETTSTSSAVETSLVQEMTSSPTSKFSGGENEKKKEKEIKILVIIIVSVAVATASSAFVIIAVMHHRRRQHEVPQACREKNYFYVSYCPESKCLIQKVVDFALWFREQGYDVQLDILHSPINEKELRELGRFRFGERQLGKAKNIFMILSTSYLRLCKLDEGDSNVENLSFEERIVYSEIAQIRSELCSSVYRNQRFIPVLFGVRETELPFWIKGLVVYTWPDDKLNNRLLYRINEQVEYEISPPS